MDDRRAGVAGLAALFGAAALAWGWLLAGAGVGMEQMDMGGGDITDASRASPEPCCWRGEGR
ncbi:MAG TPA: hypothetical protein VLV90_07465 [Burkholderiales bacterium]|nr:hypothetical protein [Burkholderiales bacterium]HUK04904.1 hypothetical protein [Burkholderiales bacterium]